MKINEKIILPEEGFVRLSTILKIIPISRSHWHAKVRKGYFLKPTKMGSCSSFYPVDEVRGLISKIKTGNYLMNSSVKGEENES